MSTAYTGRRNYSQEVYRRCQKSMRTLSDGCKSRMILALADVLYLYMS